MSRKKKLSAKFANIYAKLKQRRQLQRVKDRMKSIIQTTVGESVNLEEGKEWSYNTSSKIIYYVKEGPLGIKELPTSSVIGIMLHEISHAKYSEEINRVSFPDPQRVYALLINAIEDIRIEEKLMQRFPGTYDTFEERIYRSEKLLNEEKLMQLPPHLNLFFNYFRKRWGMPTLFSDNTVEKTFNKVEPLLDEAVMKNSTNEMEEYLFKKVWKYIKDIIPPPDPNLPPPPKDGDEEQEQKKDGKKDSEDQKSSGKNNKNKEKEDDKEDEKSDEEKEKEKQDKIDNLIDMKELQNLLYDKQQEGEQGMSMFDEENEEVSQDENMQGIHDEDFKPPTKVGGGTSQAQFTTYEELYADVAHFIPYFVKKINSIMADNKLSRTGGAYRSGKLNTKTLYKWKCNDPKLFKRKVMRQHKDYSVYLLVDQSGSMANNDKNLNAARACVLMAEVLKKSGIDFAIRGFNLTHKMYKTFDQPYNWTVKRSLENIVPATYRAGAGGNNDGYNINRASYELSRRTGEKIMIAISDGQPNASGVDIPEEDIKRLRGNYHMYHDFNLHEEITKAKRANTLIGIGINAPHVADYYPQVVLCDNIDMLPSQLLNILRKNIRRG